jgi:hypothetical protein
MLTIFFKFKITSVSPILQACLINTAIAGSPVNFCFTFAIKFYGITSKEESTLCQPNFSSHLFWNISNQKRVGIMGCNDMQFGDRLAFQENILPPSSGSKSKPSKCQVRCLLLVSYLAYSSILNMKGICSSETLCHLQTMLHWCQVLYMRNLS